MSSLENLRAIRKPQPKVELPRAKFQREFAQRRDFRVQNSLALASFENRNFSIF